MKPKHLFILSIVLALMVGCVASGPVKTEQILTPLTNKIFLEKHDQNGRSYHVQISENVLLQAMAINIYELNGVQNVRMFPYQIFVKKSPLYNWKIIEPEILRILKK